MSRKTTFEREEVGAIRGLTSLTEPGDDEPIGAVVDVAVIGARGDGKTQFIVHAIRTLRAYAPVLDGAEHQYNRDVLQVVMNARLPRPEATAPGVVPHYVFRIRAKSLLGQIGALARLSLYARVAGLWTYILLSLSNALLFWLSLDWLTAFGRPALSVAALGVFLGGTLAGCILARRRFLQRGDIELVFWDVAGEHVYSDSAADYYSFLSALVRTRRLRASAARAYAFAPVLICNPVALGTRAQGSSYARLRKLIPLFASLNEPLARALVAINRWTVVKKVCAPDTDRRELVAIVPRARVSEEDLDEVAELARRDDGGDDEPGDDTLVVARTALPVVKRDVLRKHCLDAEDGTDNDIHFTYLRYDAGMQCEFHERPWNSFEDRKNSARKRWRAPTANTPKAVLDYVYEDGPGAFEGNVRRVFLAWIAGLAFHQASYGQAESRRIAGPLAEPENADEPVAEAAFVKARQQSARREPEAESAPAGGSAGVVESRSGNDSAQAEDSRSAWRPRPLSATGLEDFARGTIVKSDWLASAIDATLRTEPEDSPADDSATIQMASPGPAKLPAVLVPESDSSALKTETDEDASDERTASPSTGEDKRRTMLGTGLRSLHDLPPVARPAAGKAARSETNGGRARHGTNPGFGSLDDVEDAQPSDIVEPDSTAGDNDDAAESSAAKRPPTGGEATGGGLPRDPSSDTLRMPGGFGSGGT